MAFRVDAQSEAVQVVHAKDYGRSGTSNKHNGRIHFSGPREPDHSPAQLLFHNLTVAKAHSFDPYRREPQPLGCIPGYLRKGGSAVNNCLGLERALS